MLAESDTYQRLTDGSPLTEVSPFLDGDILAARGVPTTAGDSNGALLLLRAGRFAALACRGGDLVGLRVTAHGFELACGPGADAVQHQRGAGCPARERPPQEGRHIALRERSVAEQAVNGHLARGAVLACGTDVDLAIGDGRHGELDAHAG